MKRALALGLSAVTIAGLGLVGTAASASAVCATNEVYTNKRTAASQEWQFRVSSASTCKDLNIIDAYDNSGAGWDKYAGFYYSGGWKIGSRGYIEYGNGDTVWKVLLSDVNNGALVSVGSWYNEGDWVTVAH